jgi:ACT domain-containing protein
MTGIMETSAKDQESDRVAVGIYAVMAFDVSDAIDMINECAATRTLDTLLKMLGGKGEHTDRELNALFVGPVKRRLEALNAQGALGTV